MKTLILMVFLVVCVAGSAPAQLIPTMTSSNTPSGLAYASSSFYTNSYLPYSAFSGGSWISGVGTTNWIAYDFGFSVTVTNATGTACGISSSNVFYIQASTDGATWQGPGANRDRPISAYRGFS